MRKLISKLKAGSANASYLRVFAVFAFLPVLPDVRFWKQLKENSSIRPSFRSIVRPFNRPSIRPSVCPFVRLFVHLSLRMQNQNECSLRAEEFSGSYSKRVPILDNEVLATGAVRQKQPIWITDEELRGMYGSTDGLFFLPTLRICATFSSLRSFPKRRFMFILFTPILLPNI